MVEEAQEVIVEAIDVEQEDWLVVEAEGLPSEDFEHLFERSEATRKNEEGLRLFGHEGLASVHGVDDVKLGDAVVGDFEIDEDLWDDTDDVAAGCEGRLGDGLHKAYIGSAVYEADVAGGEGCA